MVHHHHIRLAGAPGNRRHGEIHLVRPGIQRRLVLKNGNPRGFVGVKGHPGSFGKDLPSSFYRLMDHRRSRRTRSILEAHRIVGNIRIENIPQGLFIKIRIVGAGNTFGEGHEGNAHLVLHPGIHDGPA